MGHTTCHYPVTSMSRALGIVICGQLTDVPVICGLEQRSRRGEDEGIDQHSLAFYCLSMLQLSLENLTGSIQVTLYNLAAS